MTRKHTGERGRPGPKPGFQPAVNVRRIEARAAVEQVVPQPRVESKDPLQRSRDIKAMQGEELRAYATQIGINRRDVAALSEDRLRQNCMLHVTSLLDELME